MSISTRYTRISAGIAALQCGMFCALWLLNIPVASAQPIDSLVMQAERSYPSIAAVRTAIQRAEAQAESAEAWQAPSAGIEFRMLPPSEPNPFTAGETMLMVEQMIPLFGQNRAMAAPRRMEADVGRAEADGIRRMLRRNIEQEYYRLWFLERRVELNEENRTLAELLYAAAEARYTVNRTGQSDLLTISSEIERLKSEKLEIAEEQAEVRARLNTLLSRPVETSVAIVEEPVYTELPAFEILADRVDGHPKLRKMEAMAEVGKAEAQAKEAMLDPMLMVRGGVAWMPDGHPLRQASSHAGGDPVHLGLAAGAMITIPFAPWSRSGPENAAEAARLNAAEQLLRRDAAQQEMVGALRAAYARASRIRLQHEYYQNTQIPLLNQTLETLRNDYAGGRIPFSSVLDGYRMLVMARMEVDMKRIEYASALSMITEITGVEL